MHRRPLVVVFALLAALALARDARAQAPAISANGIAAPASTTVAVGTHVIVGVTNGPAHQWDWVKLSLVGSPSSAYVSWLYLNGSQTYSATGMANATFSMPVPQTVGSYELRFISYVNGAWQQVAVSGAIEVAVIPATVRVNGAPSTTSVLVAPEASVRVDIANGPAHPWDWVRLSVVGSPPEAYVAWRYVNGTQTYGTTGMSQSSFLLPMPLAEERYELRFISYVNNAWQQIATSGAIEVVAPPPLVGVQHAPGSCQTFTDDPVVAGSTWIKAVHFTELRTCVNDLRSASGLAAATWTDPTLTPQVTVIKAVHVTDLRAALDAVYVASGSSPPGYGTTPVGGVTTILASHVTSMRDAIRAAPAPPPGCTVAVSPYGVLGAPAAGGTGSFDLYAGCLWTAVSTAQWLRPSPASGHGSSGAQTIGYVVDPNPGPPRTAVISIDGVAFTVTQSSTTTTTCDYAFQATALSDTLAQLAVTTEAGCAWTTLVGTPGAERTPVSGIGSQSVTVEIAPPVDPDLQADLQLQMAGHTIPVPVAVSGNFLNFFRCVDSRSLLCRIIVIILPPTGSFRGGEQAGGPPVLDGPATLQRGTAGSYRIRLGTGRNASITGWRFVGEDGQTVERTSSAVNWDGIMVTSGTVYVRGTWQGNPFDLPLQVTVTPRPGWTTAAPSQPTQRVNGEDALIAVIDPPGPDASGTIFLGKNRGPITYSSAPLEVTAGPNTGYSFVQSSSSTADYFWSGSPTVLDASSPYYLAFAAGNCGDYDAVNKSYGFGLASDIRENLVRHESGSFMSHFQFFREALETPSLNPRAIMEPFVRRLPVARFENELNALLSDATSEIERRRKEEPCGDGRANFDSSCNFRGHVNYRFIGSGVLTPDACPRP